MPQPRRTLPALALGLAAGFAFVGLSAWSAPARAEAGVTADTVLLGQAAALDGPAKALGAGMRTGLLAAFEQANRAGGVNGRKIRLISRDDGYEPTKSIAVTQQLINDDTVFALIGSVGTPTSAATQPIASAAGVPFIAPFTGAEFLRAPDKTAVINLRASYFQETEAMVAHLTKDLGATRIAIFYQDDAYGRAGLEGVQRALARRKLALVAEGTYERNTVAVKRATLDIRKGRPDAVIMIGAYKPTAAFVKLARSVRLKATFVSISFVGSEALAAELGAAGQGVVVTQVVPPPTDTSLGIVRSYQAALKAAAPAATPSFVSLEGYMAGQLFTAALARVKGPLTRAALLDVFRHDGAFDLDGTTFSFGPDRNYGSDTVYITVLQPDGSYRSVDHLTQPGS